MPLPQEAGVYSTAAGDPRDRIIFAQQQLIERLTAQIETLVQQIVTLTTPVPVPNWGETPKPLTEDEEDLAYQKAMAGEEGLDLDDPTVREILAAAGALSTDIAIAD